VIRKRRDGLQVQVYAGRDPLTGRKRWVSRQVPGQTKQSYRQAKKVEAELLEQVDRGQHRGSSSRTVAELIERWFSWRQQVRPISPVTLANYRGAIDRYILPNLGRAKVRQVDASTIDALYEHVRAHGGKCRHCWQRVRRGIPPLRVGERYRPQPTADETVHKLDCIKGWPLSASAVREVHTVLSGAFKQQCLYRLERREALRQALVACRDCSWRYRAFVECRCSLTAQNACSVWAWSPALDGSFRTAHHGCAMAVLPLVGRERELGTLDDLVDCVGERGGRWWCATRLGSGSRPCWGGAHPLKGKGCLTRH
jgi:hypothetical protein